MGPRNRPPTLILERAPHRADGRQSRKKGPSSNGLYHFVLVLGIVGSGAFLALVEPFVRSVLQEFSHTDASDLSALTPQSLAAALERIPVIPPPASTAAAAETLVREAFDSAAKGEIQWAANAFRDALEADPTNERALEGMFKAFQVLFGPGQGPQMGLNVTEAFFRSMASQLEGAPVQAERLSTDPPVYLLHGLLSRQEAEQIIRIRERRRVRWAAVPPLVCFDHRSFQQSPGLQAHLLHGIGASRSRSCLSQNASHAVGSRLPRSESLSVYRGEEALLDEVGRRIEQRAGLPPNHGINFQILSYATESSYQSHTDCAAHQHLYDARAPVRMASVLVYLSDDFDGGETEFVHLGLKVKPAVGSAVVFYSYDTTPECDPRSEHRANRVTRGTKHVLQRWYSYRSDRLFDLRPWRKPNDVGLRLPWQPVLKCDKMSGPVEDGSDVSCRWYDKPTDFAYRAAA